MYLSLGDGLVFKAPKPPTLSVWLLTGVPRFSSMKCLILQEVRLTASQSQGSKKVKAEASRFLKTQALGLAQWHFHHIMGVGWEFNLSPPDLDSWGKCRYNKAPSHEVKPRFKGVQKQTVPLDGTRSSHVAKGHACWVGGICGH